MKTYSSLPATAEIKTLLSIYNTGSQYVGTEAADLNSATIPALVAADPTTPITQVSGSFTIPAKFFGVHASLSAIPALAAAGAGWLRLRDTNSTWAEMMPKGGTATFTAGPTNTVNLVAHGLSASVHGVWFKNNGGALPSGLASTQYYYVVNTTADTFQVALTPGGSPIALGSVGSGTTFAFGCVRSLIDPIAGTGKFDLLVNTAAAAGMDVQYDCTGVPAWMTTDGTTKNRPTASSYVTAYCGFLSQYYGNKVGFFEIWNEPNTAGYFNGTQTGASNDLLLYAGYWFDAIAFLGLPWKVISPSWNIQAGAALMQTWLGSGGGNAKIDIVGFHTYRGKAYLGYDDVAIDLFVAAATTAAPGKPMWVTEVGESKPTAEIIWRSHLYAAAKGIARFAWYNYDLATGSTTPGLDMKLVSYAGLADAYKAMMTQCAGKVCAYVDKGANGQIGANVNGVSVLY